MPQIIYGEIIDYKMTDGMDIGYVLITENNLKPFLIAAKEVIKLFLILFIKHIFKFIKLIFNKIF